MYHSTIYYKVYIKRKYGTTARKYSQLSFTSNTGYYLWLHTHIHTTASRGLIVVIDCSLIWIYNAMMIIKVQIPPFPWPFIAYKDFYFAAASFHSSFIINMHLYTVMQLCITQLVNTHHEVWITWTIYGWHEAG